MANILKTLLLRSILQYKVQYKVKIVQKQLIQSKLRLDILTFINFAHVHIAVVHLQGGL